MLGSWPEGLLGANGRCSEIMRAPIISVLLPVYNSKRFLIHALESLGGQTFRDYEVVAVDDGSTDSSGEILREASVRWPWLKVISQPNRGVAAALNRGLAECGGEFIARMDADDIARPTRLARQLAFLRDHPDVGVCGTYALTLGERCPRKLRYGVSDQVLRSRMMFGCALAHPTVMMRRSALEAEPGPYAGRFEDYDLWLRLLRRTKFACLPEVLLDYRVHPAQVTAASWANQYPEVWRIQSVFLRSLGMREADLNPMAHALSGLLEPDGNVLSLSNVESWLARLTDAVSASGWCESPVFERECRDAWWRAVRRTSATRRDVWRYWRSPWTRASLRTAWRLLRLLRLNAIRGAARN